MSVAGRIHPSNTVNSGINGTGAHTAGSQAIEGAGLTGTGLGAGKMAGIIPTPGLSSSASPHTDIFSNCEDGVCGVMVRHGLHLSLFLSVT